LSSVSPPRLVAFCCFMGRKNVWILGQERLDLAPSPRQLLRIGKK
jgi:hypothetical protein